MYEAVTHAVTSSMFMLYAGAIVKDTLAVYTSYKKVGGLHFVRLGRLGFSFYISKNKDR
jgi:hypothetical protein